jgi:hypothetical protein
VFQQQLSLEHLHILINSPDKKQQIGQFGFDDAGQLLSCLVSCPFAKVFLCSFQNPEIYSKLTTICPSASKK